MRQEPWACPRCGCSETYDDFVTNDVICTGCGGISGPAFVVQPNVFDSRRAAYRVVRRGRSAHGFKYSPYNPIFYYNELLRAWVGEDPELPRGFLVGLRAKLAEIGCRDVRHASRSRIKLCCRLLLAPTYGERWWQAKLRLCNRLGRGHFRLPAEVVSGMRMLFTIYVHAAVRARSNPAWGSRQPLITYRYVKGQLLRIWDYWHGSFLWHTHRWYLPQLKTTAKVADNDRRFAMVVDIINEDRKIFRDDAERLEHRKWPFLPMTDFLINDK